MRPILKKIVLCAMVCTLPVLLSGCFLRLLFGTVGERDTDFGIVFIATIGGTFGPLAICDFDPETGNLVNCDYSFFDREVGEFVRTSSAELISEFGVFGVFIDPLILQVPAGATNFTGTIDDGSGPQPIVVTEVNSFNAQPGTEISAEAGQKFVILEFPSNVISALQSSGTLSGPFDFNFEFELPSLSPVEVKAMYTGKVEINGQTFFPPMLPCVTDFADVPAITIPVSQNSVDLMTPLFPILFGDPTLACDHAVYDFTSGGPPPSPEVALDIKPGSDPNSINPNSNGVIPVAILTTSTAEGEPLDFDAATVDSLSVLFGPNGATETHGKGHNEDADGDGDPDMVLHFKTQETGIQCGDTEATLTGKTTGGQDITGTDLIQTVGCGSAKTVVEGETEVSSPKGYALYQNHPNPFNPETDIRFYLPEPNHVSIRIYNIRGEEIRRLVDSPYATGEHKIRWDGKDDKGNPVSGGVYLYRFQAGSFTEMKKMTLIR